MENLILEIELEIEKLQSECYKTEREYDKAYINGKISAYIDVLSELRKLGGIS